MRRRPSLNPRRTDSPQEDRLKVNRLQFGRLIAEDTFSVEWERVGREDDVLAILPASASDGARIVIKMWRNNYQKNSIHVEFNALSVNHLRSTSTALLFHLNHPPLFEIIAAHRRTRTQVAHLDEQHRRVAPFTSALLRIDFCSPYDRVTALKKMLEVQVTRPIASKIFVIGGHSRYSETAISRMNGWLAKLDVRVAFQLEVLLRGSLLDYSQLSRLEPAIHKIVETRETESVERILMLFSARVQQLAGAEEGQGLEEQRAVKSPLREVEKPRAHAGVKRRFDLVLDHSSEDDSSSDEEEGTFDRLYREFRVRSLAPLSVRVLEQLLSEAVAHEEAGESPFTGADHAVLSRHVTITPTRLILKGPSYEDSNAILRRYGAPQHFLRVSVRQEDHGRLRFSHDSIINDRFAPLFAEGLKLCGRRFDFLAYSSSQLKWHTAFFVEPFKKDGAVVTAETIRQALGDFSKLARFPAKYMARLGQALTSSRSSLVLEPAQVKRIDDIVSPTGSVQTDGVGLVSPAMAQIIIEATRAEAKEGARSSTCWQFRLGGAKGMLQIDPTLDGTILALRPSQIKFDSPSLSLSIVDSFQAPFPAFLNRPFIKILSDLGAPDSSFLSLQRKAMRELRKKRTTLDESLDLLERWSVGAGGGAKFSEMLKWMEKDEKTGRAAFGIPFVERCLDLCVSHCTREMKHRGRIPLGPYSFNFVGVCDHSGYLQEGEIYVCVSEPGKSNVYIHGNVAVSRSPTMHPGDIQLVRAIGKIPREDGEAARAIKGLRNCIVFSSRGLRSLPSMLAGRDLDGDIYLLLRNPELMPKRENIANPASYAAPPVQPLDHDCTIADDRDFFFKYIKEDQTGQIATRHLVLSDMHGDQGSFHRDCKQLAKLHSDAVDFAKSGIYVPFDALPKLPLERKHDRPDFMRAGGYSSAQILGQLYREFDGQYDEDSPGLDPVAAAIPDLDPARCLTKALLAQTYLGLPNGKLPTKPPQHLIQNFSSLIHHFSTELRRLQQLVSISRKLTEEELYLGIFLGDAKLDPSQREASARLAEKSGKLFALLRLEVQGEKGAPSEGKVERCWAAWMAALQADRGAATPLGVRSFGMVVLSMLGEWLEKLRKEQGVIELD